MSADFPNSPLNPEPLDLWFQDRAAALARFYRTEPLPIDDDEADAPEPVRDDADSEGWRKLCSLEDAAVAAGLGVRDEPLVRFSDVLLPTDWAEIEQIFQKEMRRSPFA